MPISKCLKKSEPPWKEWDQKAQKNGLRHQVFAVNGDHYVGEWKDNMKHGEWGAPGMGAPANSVAIRAKKAGYRVHQRHSKCS